MIPTLPPALSRPIRRVTTHAGVQRAWRYVRGCVELDTRTLAVFRIALGLLVVADLLLRSRNFHFYYTESGTVPRELAMRFTPENAFSVYFYTTDPDVIAGLFVIQALVALLLIAGYKTTLSTIATFLLVVSLDHHNPFVLSYADTLFRFLLFWAIFLPLGERWSVDAVHAASPPRRSVANLATAVILIQVIVVYVVNGLHKTRSPLWWSGEATPLILGLTDTTFLLGPVTRNFPTLLQLGGLTWFGMLLFAWLLILLRGRLRTLFTAMFISVHASFAITVRIGAFPYVSITGVLLFLQSSFWADGRRLAEFLGVSRPIHERYEATRASLVRLADRIPAVSVTDAIPHRVRHGTYTIIVVIVVVAFAFAFAMMGLQSMGYVGADTNPHEPIEDHQSNFGIDQPEWSIFAPHPRTVERYYVFPARTADGELVDVYNDRPMTFDRPHRELNHQYGTYRERFYMNSVRRSGQDGPVATQFGDHLCETWAEERDTELTHINMYVITEQVTMDTLDDPDSRDREAEVFHRHVCGDDLLEYRLVDEEPEFD